MLAALAALLLLVTPARADLLDEVQQRGVLRWAGDQEGGGPFVYPRDDDPSVVAGNDVELADALAAHLGVRAEFVQGQWDKLPEMLKAGKVDLVLSGYELTPERADVLDATIPYYAYGLQLLVRRDGATVHGWDDLVARPGARVGVLTGSAAETAIRRRCPACAVSTYEGTTDGMREVETGKLDATLQDNTVAIFYGPRFPGLVAAGPPVEEGFYVGYVPKGEPRLVGELNEALVLLVRSGGLRDIDERYGIWDDHQARIERIVDDARFWGLSAAASAEVTKTRGHESVALSARKHGLDVVTAYGPILLQSAGVTVILSVLSFPLAVLGGLLIALGRLYGPPLLRAPLAAWVEFLRGTPLLLQLYFVFFLLPEVGIVVPAFWTAVIGLAVNYSAYESEIYRAGLQAVPPGQLEAALSLGMSRPLALRRVVVPQAFRMVLPPVVNDFIALFKDTSVCSVVTVVELTKRFSVLSLSTQATVELMAMTATLYLLMSWPLSRLVRWVEARTGPGVTT